MNQEFEDILMNQQKIRNFATKNPQRV